MGFKTEKSTGHHMNKHQRLSKELCLKSAVLFSARTNQIIYNIIKILKVNPSSTRCQSVEND